MVYSDQILAIAKTIGLWELNYGELFPTATIVANTATITEVIIISIAGLAIDFFSNLFLSGRRLQMQQLPSLMLQLSLVDYLSFCCIYLHYHVEAAACTVDNLDYSYSNSPASSEYHIGDHCYCSILLYSLSNSIQMILLPDYFLTHPISLVPHLAPHLILRVIHQKA